MHILFLILHFVRSVVNVKRCNCALTLSQCAIRAPHIFWLRYVNMNNVGLYTGIEHLYYKKEQIDIYSMPVNLDIQC